MTLRLMVAGSVLLTPERHADAVRQGLVWAGQLLGRDTVLVQGGAPGLDELARDQWIRWGLRAEEYPTVEEATAYGADICMVWPHPDPRVASPGTWDVTRQALAHSITVISGWTLTPILELPEPRTVRGPHGVLLREGVIAVG